MDNYLKQFANTAEQVALDFANDDYDSVFNTLNHHRGPRAALLAVLIYKELQKMSEQVSVNPDDFLKWLSHSV